VPPVGVIASPKKTSNVCTQTDEDKNENAEVHKTEDKNGNAEVHNAKVCDTEVFSNLGGNDCSTLVPSLLVIIFFALLILVAVIWSSDLTFCRRYLLRKRLRWKPRFLDCMRTKIELKK